MGEDHSAPESDLCYVLLDKGRGWILEAVCREIDRFYHDVKTEFCFDPAHLPPAKAYYFSHYAFLAKALALNPHVWSAIRAVLFTHPRSLGVTDRTLVYSLNQCHHVITMNSMASKLLIGKGVQGKRIVQATVGADPNFFRRRERTGAGAVGLCSAYYPRKEPDRILDIVRTMPHQRFIMMGQRWEEWERFEELSRMENFEYRQGPYSVYPDFYSELDVFLSTSRLEGGPIPLLEAMMSNVVPVASRTGFAPEVIDDGRTGFIFDVDATVSTIVDLIDRAFEIRADVRKSVEHLTWKRCADQLRPCFGLTERPLVTAGTFQRV